MLELGSGSKKIQVFDFEIVLREPEDWFKQIL